MAKKKKGKKQQQAMSLEQALNVVQNRGEPYLNGSEHLGVIKAVDPESEEREIRTKVVNLRDDPVGQMAKRGQLGDGPVCDARLKAARRWQTLYEQAEIGGARGINPAKEYVDGGGFEMPDTDRRMRAAEELNHLKRVLGAYGDRLTTWILGLKYNLASVGELLGRSAPMEQKILGHRFRECLDTIAAELGISHDENGARGPKRKRDEHDRHAAYADNPALYRAVRRAAT